MSPENGTTAAGGAELAAGGTVDAPHIDPPADTAVHTRSVALRLAGTFDDVEHSETVVGDAFHPHSLVLGRPPEKFRSVLDAVRFGPFVMGELAYNVGLELDCPRVHGYHINVPTRGALRSKTTWREIHTAPGRAVIYRKDHGAVLSAVSDSTFQTFALKIDARALENTLAAMLGTPPEGEIVKFADELDLTCGKGAQWWRMVSNVRAQWAENDLLHDPLVAAPLAQSVLAGLLLAAHHQHSETLHETPQRPAPASIRRAEDVIGQRLAEPLTVTGIARELGMTPRALQRGFVEHLGATPTEYIRRRRLERVHTDLATSDPDTTTVSAIASRWGFAHLGRFASDYRSAYGVSPRQTLKA